MTVRYLRTVVVSVFVAYVACIIALSARAQGDTLPPKYVCYTHTHAQIDTVCVPRACMSAEDSAAHTYLFAYGDGRVVYRCHHRGY